MTITPAFDCDFISAMGSHNPAAVGLIKAMNQLGKEAVLVAVMEEATVVAWLAQAALRFPYMVSLHTLESACLRTIYHTPARYLAERHLLTAACNDADMVVFPTQGCCSDMKEAFSVARAKFRTIWNPVDCARVRRQSFQRIEAVEQWREKTNCFRIVHVGRLDPQKNHDLLLAACAELKARQRAFSLSIVGDGHDRPNIEQRIHTLDLVKHVSLVGEQQNPFPWIAAADVLLLTSRFEAFALVLVEAMVCGVPVISVDCPAGPTEVLNKGEFGLLVPNDDPASLADAVERLMNDASLARRLSAMGYERAQAFDVKNIISEWESVLGSLPRV
jgi:glycosyltransferase involved in cell wall biosynthesis